MSGQDIPVYIHRTLEGEEIETVPKATYDELFDAVVAMIYSTALLKGEPVLEVSAEKLNELKSLVL